MPCDTTRGRQAQRDRLSGPLQRLTAAFDAQRLRLAGDADALTVVPGVGKKVAQRVVVDLRDRLGGESELPSAGGPIVDVRDAPDRPGREWVYLARRTDRPVG